MFLESDDGVLRTRRRKPTTRRKERRNACLVAANKEHSNQHWDLFQPLQDFHSSSPLSKPAFLASLSPSDKSFPKASSAVDRRAMKTTSRPFHGPPSARQTSLRRRFDRLRHTAFPSFLPAIKATRPPWPCCSSFSYTNKVRECAFKRFPCMKTRDTSVLDLMVANTRNLVLHAETLAALCTTSFQHSTAALGGHACTKAMGLSAMALVRLISAFHISFPFHTSRVTLKSY